MGVAAAALLPTMVVRADYPAEVLSDNPLAYFRFSESVTPSYDIAANAGSGGTALDGRYTGVFTKQTAGVFAGNSSVTFANTPPSTSTAFTGAVVVPYAEALNPPLTDASPGAFSVEFWAKAATDTAVLLSPVSCMSFVSGRAGYLIYQNSGVWQFRVGVTSSTTASVLNGGAVLPGQWQHIVGVYEGGFSGTMTLYVDGAAVSGGATYEVNADAAFRIGSTNAPNRTFDGGVDEVAYYSRALTPAEVAAHSAARSGTAADYATLVQGKNPVGYWRLNEAPVSYLPAANAGTLGATVGATYRDGAKTATTGPAPEGGFLGFSSGNSAFVGNGTDAWVGTALPLLNSRSAFTVMGWIKRGAEKSTRGGYFGQNDLLEFGDADGGSNVEAWINAVNTNIKASNPTPDDQWLFIVLTGDANERVLYFDGEPVGTNASALGDYGSSAFNFNIGGGGVFNTGGDFFLGEIDEVAVFDRALSAGRVRTLYQSALGNTPVTLLNDPPALTPAPPEPIYATTTFSVDADPAGSPPLTYQWRKGGVDIPAAAGGTQRVYTKSNASAADNGDYSVVVTNAAGNVTSQAVTVTVVPAVPPVVDVAPVAKSIYSGGKFSFSVQASGTAPLSYQWLLNGEEIDGATSADYTVTASAATAGTYTVRVTNVHSSIVSDPAVATLIVPTPGSYKEYLASLTPVALWEFEETDGAYAYDTFGGHTASYFGVPEFAQPGASAGTGKSVHLDASTYAVIGNPATLAFTGPISLAAWVRPDQIPGDFGNILVQGYGGTDTREIVLRYTTAGGFHFSSYSASGGGNGLNGSIGVDHIGQWAFVVGTFDGSAYRLYINGRRLGPVLDPDRPQPVQFDWALGARADGSRKFVGFIDEAAIFNKALSAGEVNELYARATGQRSSLDITRFAGEGETPMASTSFDATAGEDTSGFTVESSTFSGETEWIYQPGTGSYRSNGQGTDNSIASNVSYLVSPGLEVTKAGGVLVTFSHRFSFESPAPAWDGGNLQVSLNGEPYQTVSAVSFVSGGYNGAVRGDSSAAIAGQGAFVVDSPGHPAFITSSAVLAFADVGDLIQLRFVASYDSNTTGSLTPPGWEIESVSFTQGLPVARVEAETGNVQYSDTLAAPWNDVNIFVPFWIDVRPGIAPPQRYFRLAP